MLQHYGGYICIRGPDLPGPRLVEYQYSLSVRLFNADYSESASSEASSSAAFALGALKLTTAWS